MNVEYWIKIEIDDYKVSNEFVEFTKLLGFLIYLLQFNTRLKYTYILTTN